MSLNELADRAFAGQTEMGEALGRNDMDERRRRNDMDETLLNLE